MLGQRIITAVILVALLLAALVWLPQTAWTLLVAALVVLAAYEWAKLSGFSGNTIYIYLGATLLVFWLALTYQSADEYWHGLPFYVIAALFWFVLAPLWLAKAYQNKSALSMALCGWVVIIPTGLAMIFLTRPFELLALMATVWVSDIAAYFCGRAFGKHKLAPAISPGKTWEGVAGALIATLIYAEGLQRMGFSFTQTGAPGYSLKITALFLLLACLGILGDLFESWMKRTAGVKDSGHILPGHGGVLDRIDALTSTLPIAALALGLMGRLH
jgi:phosphatidate cytidylyltransferase